MVRVKKDIRPVLKFGVALALSLGGILYTIFRTKKFKPSNSFPSSRSSGGDNKGEFSNDDHALQRTPDSRDSVSTVPHRDEDYYIPKCITENSTGGPSTSGRWSDGDRDGFLLPEFNELVKEFSLSSKASFSPRKDGETLAHDVGSPREYKIDGRGDHEQEITSLKNIVKTLKERERTLEIQLLEYYGLKEQEAAVMELQNRLKINHMEAKLFGLKIESLKAEKTRLEAQVADYAKVVADLEAAKLKIKQLKKKLRLDADHSKGQILALQERVMKLQEKEKKAIEADPHVQSKLHKLKDLEREADELRKSNHSLSVENSELAHKLEYVQILATSVLEDDEQTGALKEETLRLRKQNEELVKEVEQLQAHRCTDAEELVYLRWINACLRYELRNYQPVPGKIVARDLSKTLSPKSEEKAKQLILDYAHKEGQCERGVNVADCDSDWSSSQASFVTDPGDTDDTSVDNSSSHKTNAWSKSKVFGKLMRLIRGKDHHHSRSSPREVVQGVEVARYSSYSPGYNSAISVGAGSGAVGLHSASTSSQGSSKQSMDFHTLFQGSRSSKGESSNYLVGTRRNSDGGLPSGYGTLDYISKHLTDSPQENRNDRDTEKAQKAELVKYAEVLKDSRTKASFHKRSASVSFF